MDPWSYLWGDLFKQGRLDGVYSWEESCPVAASCPYFEISISLMLCFHYISLFGICAMVDDWFFECSCIECQDLHVGRMNFYVVRLVPYNMELSFYARYLLSILLLLIQKLYFWLYCIERGTTI